MTIAIIRDTIELAKLHEQQHGHLAKMFDKHLIENIHIAIQLPEENTTEALVAFVIAYIEHVPSFIEATRSITKAAKIEEYAEPFLKLAEEFFLKPPNVIKDRIGLNELMYEAYLAHRLMEEVNDRYMIRTSIPLIPLDMTMSNLIIHNLIGEPFANELDEAVHYTVMKAMPRESAYDTPEFKHYVEVHKNNRWEKEIKHWPCLTDELSIHLQLPI